MANSAFNHEPSFTIPGSTTDNALIRWDGTSGGGQLNSGIIIDDSNVITGITSLTVDNININGNTLTATSGVINIIPASGSAIVLDGVINIDAGVVTAATSITSTEFVGGGVGLTALNGTQITSGTVPVAQLGSSGSRSSSTFLNGANAWAAAGANQTPWTGNIDAGNYTLSNVGAAGNDWTTNALTLSGGSVDQEIKVKTLATNTAATLSLETNASSTQAYSSFIKYIEGDGSGSSGNMQYAQGYNASGNFFFLRSKDIDGSSTDGNVFTVDDGSGDLKVKSGSNMASVPKGIAKGWSKFTPSAATLQYNLTWVDVEGGEWDFTVGTDFSSANYVVAAQPFDASIELDPLILDQLATVFTVIFRASGGTKTDPSLGGSVVVFGDQ